MSTDIKTVDLTLALPIRYIGDEQTTIKEKLDGLKSQYVPEADGVLIRWGDLHVLNEKGIILDDQPYVFWKVSFTAQVFRPIEGKLVKGIVHKMLKYYFLAVAMDSFTVTVTIPESLLENDTVKNLTIDQQVYFKIKGSSEGVYRGELDDECLELTSGLVKQELERSGNENAYEYARDFEY